MSTYDDSDLILPCVQLVYHVRRFEDRFGRKLTKIVLDCDSRGLESGAWLYKDRTKRVRPFVGEPCAYEPGGGVDSIMGWAYHISRLYYRGMLVYREVDRGPERDGKEKNDE